MSEPTTTPDADRLVREVLAGDTAAFAGLVRMYEADVWRVGAALLRDRGATENLVQQAFLDTYAHLAQYHLGTDFGAWLRTVARNRLRKELRAAAREDRRLQVYRGQLEERLKANAAGPRDDADEYLAALRGCREELPGTDADLIRLRYERGLSFEEIGERRGQTAEAVQRMVSRVRFRLRACIEGKVGSA